MKVFILFHCYDNWDGYIEEFYGVFQNKENAIKWLYDELGEIYTEEKDYFTSSYYIIRELEVK